MFIINLLISIVGGKKLSAILSESELLKCHCKKSKNFPLVACRYLIWINTIHQLQVKEKHTYGQHSCVGWLGGRGTETIAHYCLSYGLMGVI